MNKKLILALAAVSLALPLASQAGVGLSINLGGPAVVVQPPPPPPEAEEVPPPPPPPQYVWTPGYWSWNGGQYVWVPGSYQVAQTGRHWVRHHYEPDGAGGWTFVPGHWE
jgi:hypothetical protein